MPNHSEHHYVPQFYLRNFSVDKKSLHLVNIARAKAILGASLRKQCARTKFYGFDEQMEGDLALIEDKAAPIIREIISTGRLPQPDVTNVRYVILILFTVIQHIRGVGIASAADLMMDYHAKLFLRGRMPDGKVNLSKVQLKPKHPSEFPMKGLPHLMPSAMGLRPHLLINTSPVDFITSDDPVVLHNQFCEGIDYEGVIGWASRGLQLFLPLSPRNLLILFDENVYRMGSRKSHFSTDISDPTEVGQFNAMQVMHALENVYFYKADDAERTHQLVAKHAKDRPKRPMTIVETKMNKRADGKSESLLHNFRPLLRQNLKVAAIRLKDGLKRVHLDNRSRLENRPKAYWQNQPNGQRFEVSRFISAYDDIKEPIMPEVPPFSRNEPPSS